MGNTESSDRIKKDDEDKLAYANFKKDFSCFLSSNLLHDKNSRHFLTLREVLKRFAHEFPDYQSYVMSDEEWWHGITLKRLVSLLEKELGSCVMVYSCLPYPTTLYDAGGREEYGKRYARLYETAIMSGFSWNNQKNLIDL